MAWLDLSLREKGMRNIYMIFLMEVEESGRQDVMVCVVWDYHSFTIWGPNTNCHWHPSPLLSPRVIMTISKCLLPLFQKPLEVDDIAVVDKSDLEEVLNPELCDKVLCVTHHCFTAHLLVLIRKRTSYKYNT